MPINIRARTLWEALQEPRRITAAMMCAYTIFIVIGVVSLRDPSDYISQAWGAWFAYAWPALTISGGVIGAAGTPRGRWWIERAGLILCATATVTRIISLIFLHHAGAPGNQMIQVAFDSLALVLLLVRWERIKGAYLDPTR